MGKGLGCCRVEGNQGISHHQSGTYQGPPVAERSGVIQGSFSGETGEGKHSSSSLRTKAVQGKVGLAGLRFGSVFRLHHHYCWWWWADPVGIEREFFLGEGDKVIDEGQDPARPICLLGRQSGLGLGILGRFWVLNSVKPTLGEGRDLGQVIASKAHPQGSRVTTFSGDPARILCTPIKVKVHQKNSIPPGV